MKSLSNLWIGLSDQAQTRVKLFAGTFLAIGLVVFLTACFGSTAETVTPASANNEVAAAEDVQPTESSPAETQTQEPEPTAAEANEPAAETLPTEEPTEAPQESPAAPAGASVQACDILSPDEAEAFLGEEPGEANSPVQGEGMYYVTSCSYNGSNNKITLIITENIDQDPRVPAAAFEFDLGKSMDNFGVDPVMVSDLGDMAAWFSNPDWYVNNLDVVKGYYRIYLNTGGEKSDQPPPALLALAQKVLSNLP